jgi:hypothetical protein
MSARKIFRNPDAGSPVPRWLVALNGLISEMNARVNMLFV